MPTSTNTPPGSIRPLFVAFSGKKQTGKDSSTNILAGELRERGLKVAITAFAEPLKEMCIEVLGLQREGVYGTNEQKDSLSHILWDKLPLEIRVKYSIQNLLYYNADGSRSPWPVPRSGNMSNREVLQVIGTDIFRTMFDNNIWANAPFNKDWSEYNVVILTDCRFPNEKQAVEDRGGMVIRLERDTGLVDSHISETALDEVDFKHKYSNNGSFEDLKEYLWKTILQ